jgi:hypothetical protein
MFTVMQQTDAGEKLWPGVSHVYTSCVDGAPVPTITCVTVLFAAGGLFDFPWSRNKQSIYVMNDAGATVARYHLQNPQAPEMQVGAPLPEPEKLAA